MRKTLFFNPQDIEGNTIYGEVEIEDSLPQSIVL